MSFQTRYNQYLSAVQKPFEKVVRLDFLQPDESTIAFSVGNTVARGFMLDHPTEALVQSGTLNVNLQNGTRRTCTVTLSNLDNAFDFAVNHIWFGDRIRLMMGIVLPGGTPFYLPQGVFVVQEPKTTYMPTERTITYTLTDKFALLDGTLGGTLSYALQFDSPIGARPNIFTIVQRLLHFSKFTLDTASDPADYIDPITPKFTNFYNGQTVTQTYLNGSTETVPFTSLTYDLVTNNGETLAKTISELNALLVCWYGYDASGAFFMDASQDDLNDTQKPILWDFKENNCEFLGLTETAKNADTYNNVVICGQGSEYANYYGRAYNIDPASPTNIYKIGMKTFWQNESNLCSDKQCKDLASFILKQKMLSATTISISSGQLFHLRENSIVTVQRKDKEGMPTERFIVTSYSLPIADEGTMTISGSSVEDAVFNIKSEGGIG